MKKNNVTKSKYSMLTCATIAYLQGHRNIVQWLKNQGATVYYDLYVLTMETNHQNSR